MCQRGKGLIRNVNLPSAACECSRNDWMQEELLRLGSDSVRPEEEPLHWSQQVTAHGVGNWIKREKKSTPTVDEFGLSGDIKNMRQIVPCQSMKKYSVN